MKKKEMLLTVLLLFLDQSVKIIMENVVKGNVIKVIPGFFQLEMVYNKGAAWSILNNQILFLIIIAILALVLLAWIKKDFEKIKLSELAYPLLYAGIIGNLLDRIVFHHVKDYLHFYLFGYSYPVFNLADIFIVIGTILLGVVIVKGEKENGKNISRNRSKRKN